MTTPVSIVGRIRKQTAVPFEQDSIDVRAKQLLSTDSADILRYFHRRTAEPEDAADLLGEAMMIVWKKRSSIPADGTEARMWFFGVARRTLSNHHRSTARREALSDSLKEQMTVTRQTTAGSTHDNTAGDQIRELIARLPAVDREIVRLAHWERLALVDIAKVLRIPASTVRSRYRRAKLRLAAEILADQKLVEQS
jgi:RNA polymerase sigma-70 factor, ECF subfamily